MRFSLASDPFGLLELKLGEPPTEMRIKNVDFPEELLNAQRSGKLVVFAGAGVSMGPPSNLPDFDGLARLIGKDVVTRSREETADRYLGRLVDRGVKVEDFARKICGDRNSHPTSLHGDLVALFRHADVFRLVTTNFDPHFDTIAADRLGSVIPTYCGPAVPLGRDLRGLVHLHGSVLNAALPLVLTDRDFGKAYITDAWATRMLVEMFSNFTVLFVGYSGRDPVMRYIARSLPPRPEHQRFALVQDGNNDWADMDVTRIVFPRGAGSNEYEPLEKGIHGWAVHIGMGLLDHEQQIRQIVSERPPIDPERADYMASVVKDEVMLRFFLASASGKLWVDWADDNGVLDRVFRDQQPDQITWLVAAWLTRFALSNIDELLGLVETHGATLNPALWHQLAMALRQSPQPAADITGKCLALLVETDTVRVHTDAVLEPILLEPNDTENLPHMLLLWAHLIRPRIKFKQGLSYDDSKPSVRTEIVLRGQPFWLAKAWQQKFQPALAQCWPALETCVTSSIKEAHSLLRPFRSDATDYDIVGISRVAIEERKSENHVGSVDILIESARDIIEWLSSNHSNHAEMVVSAWLAADVTLLTRLGIYGLSEVSQLESDVALTQIMESSWLYARQLKAEVFRLLRHKYPTASEPLRQRLVAIAKSTTAAGGQEVSAYERYNLAVWLYKIAPDCAIAKAFFHEEQRTNPTFGPRDHPDRDVTFSGAYFVSPTSPIAKDELLSSPPDAHIEELLSFQGDEQHSLGPNPVNREGLLSTVELAVVDNFLWSLSLGAVLLSKSGVPADLWVALIHGWRKSCLKPGEWTKALSHIRQIPSAEGTLIHATAELLEDGISKEDCSIPIAVLNEAEQISDILLAAGEDSATDFEDLTDWLGTAINRIGGVLAQLWLKALQVRREAAGDQWDGLPSDYSERFGRVISGSTQNAVLARVVLASQTRWLLSLDSRWTKENMLPLFNWERDSRTAQQAWQAFSFWGGWDDAIMQELLPNLRQAFAHFRSESDRNREAFCQRLVGMALYSSIDPLDDGWLKQFVKDASEEMLAEWASAMAHSLRGLKDEAVQTTWDRWMSKYWSERLTGIPRPLTSSESTAMLHWVLCLSAVAEEAIGNLRRTPITLRERDQHWFHQLLTSPLPDSKPDAVVGLLIHVLDGIDRLSWACGDIGALVRKLAENHANREQLFQICNAMARLGCSNAADTRRLIEGMQ